MTEIADIVSANCTDTVCAGENKQRLTRRNYYGQPFVPGYAPKCDDPQTCELIVKLAEYLAALEDLLEYPDIFDSMPQEAIDQLKRKGIIE